MAAISARHRHGTDALIAVLPARNRRPSRYCPGGDESAPDP
ncbi:hypothetical protein [Marinitenerispora sediminis]|nr:hypothetical protein [Marinitenerispora sediminis]